MKTALRHSKPALEPSVAPDFFSAQVDRARRFYLDLNPSRRAGVTVVCGGVEHSAPNYRVERSTFPYYSIEYVSRGTGHVVLNGVSFVMQPGVVFSYGPGISQAITANDREPLIKYFIDFTGPGSQALLAGCGLKPGTLMQVYPPNTLQALMEEIVENGLRGRSQSGEICSALLQVLVLKIDSMRMPVQAFETPAFGRYSQCRSFMEARCEDLKGLGAVARECHVSEAYVCRLFARFGKESPYRYLTRLKMNRAAELLQTPGILVKEVAQRVGFEDALHFSRVFKRFLGISPEQFRRFR